jgi:hypothetical protein
MKLYKARKSKINNNTIKCQIGKTDGSKLTYGEFLELLKSENKEFLSFFRSELAPIPSEFTENANFSYF